MTRYKSKEAYNNNLNYIKAYNKEAYKQFGFKINKYTEPELLEWILKQDNVQGYIKKLIYNDMAKNKN